MWTLDKLHMLQMLRRYLDALPPDHPRVTRPLRYWTVAWRGDVSGGFYRDRLALHGFSQLRTVRRRRGRRPPYHDRLTVVPF